MVTGERPFDGLHPGQIMVGVQAGSLGLEWPAADMHPRLLRLGQCCLEHDRKRRPLFAASCLCLGLITTSAAMTRALGRSSADFILDSYRGLFIQHREKHGANGAHMVFPEE